MINKFVHLMQCTTQSLMEDNLEDFTVFKMKMTKSMKYRRGKLKNIYIL